MRTQNVSSSFEAHIASYAVVLWDREPGEVPWGKPMFMAASNREEAEDILSRLSSVLYFDLRKTSEGFLDRLPELMEQPRVAWEDHHEVGMFCRDATFVLWDAVRVMVCLRGDYPPRLPRDLDFAGFVAALPPDVRAGCAPWAEEVAKIDVSYYESYCGDRVCCFPTASGSDTVEIARTLAGAAARAAIEASEQMHRALAGAGYDTICDTDFCLDVKDDAAEVLALLERWDPPIAGVAAPAAPAERAGASPAGD